MPIALRNCFLRLGSRVLQRLENLVGCASRSPHRSHRVCRNGYVSKSDYVLYNQDWIALSSSACLLMIHQDPSSIHGRFPFAFTGLLANPVKTDAFVPANIYHWVWSRYSCLVSTIEAALCFVLSHVITVTSSHTVAMFNGFGRIQVEAAVTENPVPQSSTGT